jgi:hypothetical protein
MTNPATAPFVGTGGSREAVDASGYGFFGTAQQTRQTGFMQDVSRAQTVDAAGMTTTQVSAPATRGQYGQEVRQGSAIDATGMTSVSVANSS